MKIPSRSPDTSAEAAWLQMQVFRRMAPAKRLRITLELGDSLRAIVASGVRSRHPGLNELDVKHAVARLILGEDLFRKSHPDVNPRQ